jgi:hypothetical protein
MVDAFFKTKAAGMLYEASVAGRKVKAIRLTASIAVFLLLLLRSLPLYKR